MDQAPDSPQPSKKPLLPTVLWVAGMVAAALLIVFSSRAIANWYLSRIAANGGANCSQPGSSHFVFIRDGNAEPATTSGVLCDTLTIINQDPKLRLIAFGPHDRHVAYDGVTEQDLAENQSMTITFDKVGRYTFHDHIDDSSKGTFTVTSR